MAGATENAAVCSNLLDDIQRRGLDMGKDYLFVITVHKLGVSGLKKKTPKEGAISIKILASQHKDYLFTTIRL